MYTTFTDNNNIRKLKDRNQNGTPDPIGQDELDETAVQTQLADSITDLETPQVATALLYIFKTHSYFALSLVS